MLTRDQMSGIYALVPTPYTEKGRFDEGTFRENIRKLCESGIHGIATTGTVGEFNTIPWEDHKRLIKALVEEISKSERKVWAIAGCTGVNTKEAVKKTKFAEECGADAVMNVVPFYQRLNKKEIIRYWQDLAEACPNIGLIVYNNPLTGKVLHDAEIFSELSRIPNIIGSKETVNDFSHWISIIKASNLAHMHIDSLLVPTMMWGGKGCFSFIACIKPDLILKAYNACKKENWQEAIKLQYKLNELLSPYNINGYDVKPGGDPVVYKAFVESAGFLRCGPVGKPYLPLPKEVRQRLQQDVKDKLDKLVSKIQSLRN